MSGEEEVRISVVIPTMDRGPATIDTVESVLGNSYPNFEVIIGDQSRDDCTQRALHSYAGSKQVRYFSHPRAGVALNRNLGAWRARGEIVAYVDDDCTVPRDWLQAIARAFGADGRIGMVFGNILAGPHDREGGFVQAYVRKQDFTATTASQKHLVEGIGACMAIRKRVWEEVGGFDLGFGTGAGFRSAEDTDLSFRVLLAGYHVHETPEIQVVHHGFRTWQQRPAMLRNYLYGLGAMCGKHLRCGNWQVMNLMLAYAYRWSFAGPAVDLGTRPPRVARLRAFCGGITSGIVTKCDRNLGVVGSFSEYLKLAPRE